MQINNFKRYTKQLKLILMIILMLIMGSLYSCNSKNKKENIQFQKNDVTHEEVSTQNVSITHKEDINNKIYVHVCGCVANQGVYELDEGSRVYEAIELAGGITMEADTVYLNMAEVLIDGQKVYVPIVGETVQAKESGVVSSLININTATKEQLMTLPGIGESRANDIISYRQANGKFESIEDIKKVSGIKDAAFNKIKELISIK